jgi:hypothetical protein
MASFFTLLFLTYESLARKSPSEMRREKVRRPSEMEGCPVDNIEDQEDTGERDKDGHVHGASLVLYHWGSHFAKRLDFHLKQNDGIFKEGTKNEENAAKHPRLHGV